MSGSQSEPAPLGPLGPALRKAWVAYQRRIDEAMAAAGFTDRHFPDGRVLRLCRDHAGTTISEIGRALGITRQAAAKVVGGLRDRGYVAVEPSPDSGREKTVALTSRALEYLAVHRDATRAIDRQLRRHLGADGVASLAILLQALGASTDDRLRDYLREKGIRDL
jgi:DNA-binding MarR family transcriptional regulator